MKTPSKILALAAVAGSAFWFAGPVAAAPLSGSLSLKNSGATPLETVQYRRTRGAYWRGGNGWIGPAAGAAAGFAIGSALAAPYYDGHGYNSYAYDGAGYDSYAYSPRASRDVQYGSQRPGGYFFDPAYGNRFHNDPALE
jgi:hypothetical protein